MNLRPSRESLEKQLAKAGIAIDSDANRSNFPILLPTQSGETVELSFSSPLGLTGFSEDDLGFAVLDNLGFSTAAWGLAHKVPEFRKGRSVLGTALSGLLTTSAQGSNGSLYLDGLRYFSSGGNFTESGGALVLITNARDEQRARKQAQRHRVVANTLKKLGKALSMNQTALHTSVAAAHELASTLDLAAVLIWTAEEDEKTLNLVASVGVNRQGVTAINTLHPNRVACVAELSALEHKTFFAARATDHLLTAELENRFTYLKAGGVSVHPLMIADRLIGVLEIVGKDGDASFEENLELFQTIAEHLALALNSSALYERAELLASHDPLTGIANHRTLQEFITSRLHEAQRTQEPLSLVMIDVDHFRSFNEEEGHDAGDEVLKMVALTLKKTLRPYDLAARYGGEEFTVVLPGVNQETAKSLCERLRQAIAELVYETPSGRPRGVTISLGVSMYPKTALEPAHLFKAADQALYEAKKKGRNQTVFYEGTYKGEPIGPAFQYSDVLEWLSKKDQSLGENLLESVLPSLEALEMALNLSNSQREILRAVILAYPASQVASSRKKLEKSDAWRLIGPSLGAIHSRYDEAGSRIPLLARVASVLLSLQDHAKDSAIPDVGRFDPEVLTKMPFDNRAA